MKNTWYIVRHGQSENNVLEIYNSHIDDMDRWPLTDQGRHEIVSAAAQIQKLHKIFSSPFRRTLETAEIFKDHSGADLHVDHRLREIDLGALHHQPHIDLPDFEEHDAIFEGESIAQIRDRMLDFVHETDDQHQDQTFLIVTHGGTIEVLKHYLKHDHPFRFSGLSSIPANGEVIKLS